MNEWTRTNAKKVALTLEISISDVRMNGKKKKKKKTDRVHKLLLMYLRIVQVSKSILLCIYRIFNKKIFKRSFSPFLIVSGVSKREWMQEKCPRDVT